MRIACSHAEKPAIDVQDASISFQDASIFRQDASISSQDASIFVQDASISGQDASISGQDVAIDSQVAAILEPEAMTSAPGTATSGGAWTQPAEADLAPSDKVPGSGRSDLRSAIGAMIDSAGCSNERFECPEHRAGAGPHCATLTRRPKTIAGPVSAAMRTGLAYFCFSDSSPSTSLSTSMSSS